MRNKKLFLLLLVLVMMFSLIACGGKAPSGGKDQPEEKNDGEVTAEEMEEAMEVLEELAEDLEDYEPADDEWPFRDIPEWPVAEGLNWGDYYGENQIDIFAKGSEDDMLAWVEALRGADFKGYYWGGDDLEFYIDNYWIYLDDRGTGDGEFHLVVRSGDMELGFPEEIEGLFPAYNGDGALVYGGSEEYDGEAYYFFSAVGETEEGGQRYLQALKDAGFASESDAPYSGAGGYYYKTEGGQRIGYASEEYWYEIDEATGTGWADFSLTVAPE